MIGQPAPSHNHGYLGRLSFLPIRLERHLVDIRKTPTTMPNDVPKPARTAKLVKEKTLPLVTWKVSLGGRTWLASSQIVRV